MKVIHQLKNYTPLQLPINYQHEAGYSSTEDGREYRLIDDDDNIARKLAFDLFYDALEGIGCDISRIEWFNRGVNTYHSKRDKQ